jgi:adenine-specific DNA-methyltransferase
VYLNSTLADEYFRQFSGHTQVNAQDLRSMNYPPKAILRKWGKLNRNGQFGQEKIDALVEKALANELQ